MRKNWGMRGDFFFSVAVAVNACLTAWVKHPRKGSGQSYYRMCSNHLEERLLDQAQAPYTPPFLGSFTFSTLYRSKMEICQIFLTF